MNSVRVRRRPLRSPEDDLAACREVRLVALHVRDLPRGRPMIEWCQPQPWLPVAVTRRDHDLLAVGRDIVGPAGPSNDRQTREYAFTASGFQVQCPELTRVQLRNAIDDAVKKLSFVSGEFRVAGEPLD